MDKSSDLNSQMSQINVDLDDLWKAEKQLGSANHDYLEMIAQLDTIIENLDDYWLGKSADAFKNKVISLKYKINRQIELNRQIIGAIIDKKDALQEMKIHLSKLQQILS